MGLIIDDTLNIGIGQWGEISRPNFISAMFLICSQYTG